MKIYVSEKDLSPIQINQIKEYGKAAHYFRTDIERYVKIAVSSLEQHEAEIRKPLEDEIERLCRLCDKLNNDYLKQKEISDYGMKELNIAIRQLKQERQEVIAELEEWVDKNTFDFVIKNGYFTAIEPDDLKQKLKEMKGGVK